MARSFDLTKDAMLVRLFIRQGGQTASSKTLQEEAAEKHNADKRSVRGVVQIITPEDRKELQRVISAARTSLYRNTLPWDDNAYRLLPLKRHDDLTFEMEQAAKDFYDAVANLTARYDELRDSYHRRVNDLAEEIPFPTRRELEESFELAIRRMPIADLSDLRLNHVPESTVEEIKAEINMQLVSRIAEAQSDIVNRLIDLVTRLEVQCNKTEKVRYHETLVTNIQDAVNILPALNVGDNEEIAALIELVNARFSNVDLEEVKKDVKYRALIAEQAAEVADELRSYLSQQEV